MRHGKCYGATVMGERGQVVIPAEAREEIGITPGEKLIVFGDPHRGMLIIFRSEIMARFADLVVRKAGLLEDLFRDMAYGGRRGFRQARDGEAEREGD